MSSSGLQKLAVAISVIVYALLIILSVLSGRRTDWPVFENLFNNRTVGDVSDEYPVNITPAGYAFSIWGVIYTWQALWLVYVVITVIRKAAPVILPYSFHAGFVVTCIVQFAWLVVWTHQHPTGSFILLALDWVAVAFTLTISYITVEKYRDELLAHRYDRLALQILVQNGLSILTSWSTVATCINLSVMLVYSLSLSQTAACCIALSVLTVIALVYYVVENFIFPQAFRTTFIPWLVLIWALIASLVKNYSSSYPESIFTVVLLALTGVLLVIRIVLLFTRQGKIYRGMQVV